MSFMSGGVSYPKKPLLLVQKADGSYACLVQGACFVAGTPVSTATGFQPIEAIAENDLVESYNETTGLFSFQKVKQVFRKTTQQLVRLVIGSDTLYSTPEHLFMTEQKEWFAAGALKPGMRLLTVAGLSTVLHATAIDTTAQVYNFEVAATHTYTVGHGKTVVHNDCTWFASLVNISAESVDKLKKLKVSHPDLIPKLKAALGTSGPDVEKFLADFNGNTTMLGKFMRVEIIPA